MSKRIKIKPLQWEPHHVKNNGFYGFTATGAHIVYVYRPVNMRHTHRRHDKWAIYQYWGANPDRCKNFGEISDPKTGKPKRYDSCAQAKAAAQRYWKREVRALLK